MSIASDDIRADIVIIGSGGAGAACALRAAQAGLSVLLLTSAAQLLDSNTNQAQGGIVARPPGDTAESLAADIINAGDGLVPDGGGGVAGRERARVGG